MVWATRRSAASYTLVWAVTVVRPRCTGTATARTVPPVTGRNMWLVEVIVAVVLPSGSPRNVDQRARAVRQGHQDPAVQHPGGRAQVRGPVQPGDHPVAAARQAEGQAPAKAISAECQVNEQGEHHDRSCYPRPPCGGVAGPRVAAALAAAALMASLTGAARQPTTLYPVQAAFASPGPYATTTGTVTDATGTVIYDVFCRATTPRSASRARS